MRGTRPSLRRTRRSKYACSARAPHGASAAHTSATIQMGADVTPMTPTVDASRLQRVRNGEADTTRQSVGAWWTSDGRSLLSGAG